VVNDRECHDWRNSQLTLLQHLHEPSVTLSRKYSSNDFSCVSIKLASALAEQAAIQQPHTNGLPQTHTCCTTLMDYGPLLGAHESHPTNRDAPDSALVAVYGQVNDFACTPPRQTNDMATIQDTNTVQSFHERFTNPLPLCNSISSNTMLEAGMFNKVPMLILPWSYSYMTDNFATFFPWTVSANRSQVFLAR
jgi:hypothetical protein